VEFLYKYIQPDALTKFKRIQSGVEFHSLL
jgi:hypothetical protein